MTQEITCRLQNKQDTHLVAGLIRAVVDLPNVGRATLRSPLVAREGSRGLLFLVALRANVVDPAGPRPSLRRATVANEPTGRVHYLSC